MLFDIINLIIVSGGGMDRLSETSGRTDSISRRSDSTSSIEDNQDIGQALDLRHAKLSTTKPSVYRELCKTEGAVSALFKQLFLPRKVKELLDRVSLKPSEDQKVKAIMLVRFIETAKQEPRLQLALESLESSLNDAITSNPLLESFNQTLVKEAQKELFLKFARKEALKNSDIEQITSDLESTLTNPPSSQMLLEAYVKDPICQSNTARKLRSLDHQIRQKEGKASQIRQETLVKIDSAAKKVITSERAYFALSKEIKALANRILKDDHEATDDEMASLKALDERSQELYDGLVEAKEAYDQITSYTLYLDQHVEAVSEFLDEINSLKDDYDNYKAPFNNAQSTIATMTTTPRINTKLPGLRTFSSIIKSFESAIYNKDRVLASRIFYELEEYESPVEGGGFISCFEALLAQIELPPTHSLSDAQEVFKRFFQTTDKEPEILITNALRKLKQKAKVK